MRSADGLSLITRSLVAQPLRTLLTASGITIGVAAVVLLTALGTGLQRYVLAEFTQFGTHLMAVVPGRNTTFGASPGVFGSTRPLSLDDAQALARLSGVEAMVPVVQGNARVKSFERARRTDILGVGPQALGLWQLALGTGRFLPDDDPRAARPLAVLGSGIAAELFPDGGALGTQVRIGALRFRVIGVMAPRGQILGFDIDRTVYIPAARALELFDREGLMEIDLLYSASVAPAALAQRIEELMRRRHGRDDVTVITQTEMLAVLDRILGVLTLAVAALGAVSLLVGAVGVLTLMTISVGERVNEIGLLRALGAGRRTVLWLFLGEAVALAGFGGLTGVALGAALALGLDLAVAALPVSLSFGYTLIALTMAICIGLVAGVMPARRAASLEPVEALREE